MKRTLAMLLILVVLLIPFPSRAKDGGTVHYDALLYDIYDVHRFKPTENLEDGFENEYIEGVIIEIFGIQVFNNTEPHVDH